jgi:hypothetical protein
VRRACSLARAHEWSGTRAFATFGKGDGRQAHVCNSEQRAAGEFLQNSFMFIILSVRVIFSLRSTRVQNYNLRCTEKIANDNHSRDDGDDKGRQCLDMHGRRSRIIFNANYGAGKTVDIAGKWRMVS